MKMKFTLERVFRGVRQKSEAAQVGSKPPSWESRPEIQAAEEW